MIKESKPTFKTGGSLPCIDDGGGDAAGGGGLGGFPSLPGQPGSLKENQNLTNKAKKMFDDLDLDDDFSDGEEKANKGKGEATDLAFEQESESGEFDANELLDFTDYKNKRQ